MKHGVYTTYTHGCRCDPCREVHTEVQRDRFKRDREARAATDAPHGTPSGYMNWSCRCDDCKQGYSNWLANRRANKGY